MYIHTSSGDHTPRLKPIEEFYALLLTQSWPKINPGLFLYILFQMVFWGSNVCSRLFFLFFLSLSLSLSLIADIRACQEWPCHWQVSTNLTGQDQLSYERLKQYCLFISRLILVSIFESHLLFGKHHSTTGSNSFSLNFGDWLVRLRTSRRPLR